MLSILGINAKSGCNNNILHESYAWIRVFMLAFPTLEKQPTATVCLMAGCGLVFSWKRKWQKQKEFKIVKLQRIAMLVGTKGSDR